LDGLGIQYPDYWGTNTCVISFVLPTSSDPQVDRHYYHGFGEGVKCNYIPSFYANFFGKFGSDVKSPEQYGLGGIGNITGGYSNNRLHGMRIQDFPEEGKFGVYFYKLYSTFHGARCDVMAIKMH
jgi:hypothetical protein